MSCVICYKDDNEKTCKACSSKTCNDCFNKVDMCPFCRDPKFGSLKKFNLRGKTRYSYGSPRKHSYDFDGSTFYLHETNKNLIVHYQEIDKSFRFKLDKDGIRHGSDFEIDYDHNKNQLEVSIGSKIMTINIETRRYIIE